VELSGMQRDGNKEPHHHHQQPAAAHSTSHARGLEELKRGSRFTVRAAGQTQDHSVWFV
jgi:hypothetical protein